MLVQDSGRFEPTPPHAQRGTASKIVTLPHLRMVAAGAGSVAALLEWQKALAAGVAGETLAELAEYAPGLLRGLWHDRERPPLTVVVAALDDTGRAGGLLMQAAREFHPEPIRRGTVLLCPDTAAEIETAEPTEPADDTQPAPAARDETPAEPEWVDWPALRLKLLRGVREQVSQRRVPLAEPFVSALLHSEGIDLRTFHP